MEPIFIGEVHKSIPLNQNLIFTSYDRLMRWDGREVRLFHDFGREIQTFAILEGGRFLVSFGEVMELYQSDTGRGLVLLQHFEPGGDIFHLEADEAGRLWAWSHRSVLHELRDNGVELELVSHPEVAGEVLAEQDVAVAVTDRGPVLLLEDRLIRKPGNGEDWQSSVFPPGTIDLQAHFFQWVGPDLQGWLVYWDPEAESSVILELDWPTGAEPTWHRLPWLDLSSLGRIQQIQMNGESLVLAGRRGLMVADRVLSAEIPPPGKPVIWDVGRGNVAATELDLDSGPMELRYAFGETMGSSYYPVRFQTRIAGLEGEWSLPSRAAIRELGQLMAGSYHLEVRAVDPFGRTGPVAVVGIHINPPWYLDYPAIAAYVILFLFCGAMILQLQGRLHQRRQRILAGMVRQKTQELDKANRFKDDFIANLSHEIRNPLNGVIGLISGLKDGVPTPSRNLGALKNAANYLKATVEDVLDFARMDSGRLQADKSLFGLHALVRGIIQIYEPQAEAKGVELRCCINLPEGTGIMGDERKVQQILGNLTSNAVKFTNSGFVEISIGLVEAAGGCFLELRVRDSGCGIPESEQARVFDKFYQVEKDGPKVGGTGIGLSLVQAYVGCLEGHLELHSEPGFGSEFLVSLPVETQPLANDASTSPAIVPGGLQLPVLVVEDQEYNRIVLEDKLRALGCRVDSVADGQEGLARALDGDFRLVILDWDLPSLGGLDIARALRASPQVREDLVIVGMTAFATMEVRQTCLGNGMDAFLTKPLDEQQLRDLVAKLQTASMDSLIEGRGLLMEMQVAGGWPAAKARWLADYAVQVEEAAEAVRNGTLEAVRFRVHRLMGHLSMIRTRGLTEGLKHLQVAAMAGDVPRVQLEWERFEQRQVRFRRELDRL